MENLIIIPTLIMGGALMATSNPLYMILILITISLNISLLLIMQGLTFLALLLTIIYVGAIAILFLFIIFLLNLRNIEPKTTKEQGFHSAMVYVLLLLYIVYSPTSLLDNPETYYTDVFQLSEETDNLSIFTILYNQYNILFFTITIVLLLAMIAVILITKETKKVNIIKYKIF